MCSKTRRPASIFEKSRDVVDDMQQAGSRVVYGVGVPALLVVQRGRQEEFGHAEDAVHGGSNFMTHVGQELGFGQAGAFGGVLRATEALFLLLSLGNVLHEDGELLRPADGETTHGDFYGETCSLNRCGPAFHTRRLRMAPGTNPAYGVMGAPVRVEGHEVGHVGGQGIVRSPRSVGRQTSTRPGCSTPVMVPVCIRRDHGVEGGFDDHASAGLALQDLILCEFIDPPEVEQGRTFGQDESRHGSRPRSRGGFALRHVRTPCRA